MARTGKIVNLDIKKYLIKSIADSMRLNEGNLVKYRDDGHRTESYKYLYAHQKDVRAIANSGDVDANYITSNCDLFVKESLFVRNINFLYSLFSTTDEEEFDSDANHLINRIKVRINRKADSIKSKPIEEMSLFELKVISLMQHERISKINKSGADALNFSRFKNNQVYQNIDYDKVEQRIKRMSK